jgi:hypothetical protein
MKLYGDCGRSKFLRGWSETKQATNKFSPEVRSRAVRRFRSIGGEYASECTAIGSIAAKTGYMAETLRGRQLRGSMGVRKVRPAIAAGEQGCGAMHSGEADARRGIAGLWFAASRRGIQAAKWPLPHWIASIAETGRLVRFSDFSAAASRRERWGWRPQSGLQEQVAKPP